MIDYNRLEETLKKYIYSIKYEEGTVEEYAKKLTNYFESLIEKEFRLVASGEVIKINNTFYLANRINNKIEEVCIIDELLEFCEDNKIIFRLGKNISIYIKEDDK